MITRAANRYLLTAVLACALMLSLHAGVALASFGELAHFGEAGTGKGQFNMVEAFNATDAIGVDPATNAVYVVDGPTKKEFRIQKFELQSGKWQQVAERKFKPGLARGAGIEGVAVDHARNRLYVLALQERAEAATVDPEVVAAGALFSFTASTLEPSSGTTEGLLDDPTALHTTSNTVGAALLEPAGLAVDPVSGDVIVLGYEDPVGEDEELQVVLQRVGSDGTLGARWSDETGFFTAHGEMLAEASSPVVSATGQIYVADGELPVAGGLAEEIDEVPSNFAAKGAPKPVVEFGYELVEPLITFPGVPSPLEGGGLALGPDGTFYAYAQLLRQEAVPFHEPAVLAFGGDGAELGWFGGQNQPRESAHVQCAISFRGSPVVAAGAGGDVFVFDSDPSAPDVVEFGPGGSGCPTASATAPAAFVGTEPVASPVKVGTKVRFASTITQADALTVEWEFVNKATKATEKVTGPANEFESPEITHAFSAAGEYSVKETITTDDLGTPTLMKESSISVEAGGPTAQFSAPLAVNVGEAAKFDAKTSSGNGNPITSYTWNFGDGTAPVETSEPAVSHTFSSAATYTVSLSVKTVAGTSGVAHTIDVLALSSGSPGPVTTPVPPPTTTTPSGSGGPAGQTPGGAVLSYRASIAGTALAVARGGAVTVKVACQGQSSCTGSVTLRTQGAVAAKRKAILTLASGSFSAAGGTTKTVTLHLSAKALALLARVHSLKAVATIAARDASGGSHTSIAVVTLKPARRIKH